MAEEQLTALRKALQINIDERKFGTFAEIGAGQEVARQFFQAGGAAGTIAKTMSAYDMTFSDEIYGKTGRYVSKERLISMLDHEYALLLQRLSAKRGEKTQFFVFANTVSARNFRGTNECHGWLGVRFQKEPLAPPSDIVIHVRMLDRSNQLQQQALGIIGVNLIHSAFFCENVQEDFVPSLLDDLTADRIEVDMLELHGPNFQNIDNRMMSLKLVQHELTDAVMFAPDCKVLQPSEVLYKKTVLVERGSFRPVTHVNLDMLDCARNAFNKDPLAKDKDSIVLAEITLNNLMSDGALDPSDFLARVDTISSLGLTVLISDYPEFYRLISFFRRYTKEMIGVVMGLNTLLQVFNEKHYENLEGGILESLGRLFRHHVKLYTYPMGCAAYESYLRTIDAPVDHSIKCEGELITAKDAPVLPHLKSLYRYLMEQGCIVPLEGYNKNLLGILSRDLLAKIAAGDAGWEEHVPAPAAAVIKQRHLMGWKNGAGKGVKAKAPALETSEKTH